MDRVRNGRPRTTQCRRAEWSHAPRCGVHLLRTLDFVSGREGLGIRAGRFLPAYGVRLADHAAYTRSYLDLDRNDQVYGLEVNGTVGPSLIQVMVSPGKAEAILHNPGHRGFSTAARWQF